ncbi:hypothetical protein [Domibacillus iocasae]|uniref:hypothetical protein n=1 Tax=Domibacillus iocasae TaxID=1714016 RepID=UPI001470A787|nr:hypothetical protein [Domibacillus iocasae]
MIRLLEITHSIIREARVDFGVKKPDTIDVWFALMGIVNLLPTKCSRRLISYRSCP